MLQHNNLPPSTLHDYISGKVFAGAVSGALYYLDEDEEKELVIATVNSY